MNESIAFSNYEIFNDAIEKVNNLNAVIETANTSIKGCQTQLESESIFMGPIADLCKDEFNKITTKISSMKESLDNTKTVLSSASDNYKNGETAAAKALDSTGSTTLGNTQASSFYELGDRAYEGDSAAQQEWIEKVAKIVDSSQYSKYGLKNSLIIAQIINESGWMHTPTKTNDDGSTLSGNNNVIGINTYMGDGILEQQDSTWSKKRNSTQSNVMQWDENGKVIGTSEAMRTYDSIEECIEDYANVLYIYHPECKGSNDLEKYRDFLEGYTPNPNGSTTDYYAGVIERFGLEKYDR